MHVYTDMEVALVFPIGIMVVMHKVHLALKQRKV